MTNKPRPSLEGYALLQRPDAAPVSVTNSDAGDMHCGMTMLSGQGPQRYIGDRCGSEHSVQTEPV